MEIENYANLAFGELCEKHAKLTAQHDAFFMDGATPIANDKVRTAAQAPICDEREKVADEICAKTPKTPDEFRALARAIVADQPYFIGGKCEADELNSDLVRTLLRGLASN